MKTRILKPVLSVAVALSLLTTAMLPAVISANEPAAEPLYWNFTGDSDYVDGGSAQLKLGSGTYMENSGSWEKGPNNTSDGFYATDAHRLDFNFKAGHGTIAVQTQLEPGIDGSKYDTIKLDIGSLSLSGVTSYKAYLAFENGDTEESDIDTPAYQKEFDVPHMDSTGLVEVDMSEMTTWTDCNNISYLRIAVVWQAGFAPGTSRVLLDYVEICPKETETPPVDPPTEAEDIIYDFSEGDHGFAKAWDHDPPTYNLVYNDTEKAMEGQMLLGYGSISLQKAFDPTIDVTAYKTVKVSIKNPTAKPIMASIGIEGKSNPGTIEGLVYPTRFEVAGNSNEYVDYYIQVAEAENTLWPTTKDLAFFRLQLCVVDGNMTPNESIFVKKIEILAEKQEAPPVEVDPTDFNFDFMSDMQGFALTYGVTAGTLEYDATEMALKATMLQDGSGSIPFQRALDTVIDGADYKTVKVTLKNTTGKALTGALSYNLEADGAYVDNPESLIKFNIKADSDYVTYFIQVGENEAWNAAKAINLVRFYIGQDDLIKDGVIYVSRIEFLTDKEEETVIDDSTDHDGDDSGNNDTGSEDNDADTDEDNSDTGVESYVLFVVTIMSAALAVMIRIRKRQGEK